MKICPLKFNSKTLDADGTVKVGVCLCEGEECEFYNYWLGNCA